jgi:hypothetical protein
MLPLDLSSRASSLTPHPIYHFSSRDLTVTPLYQNRMKAHGNEAGKLPENSAKESVSTALIALTLLP